MKFITALLKSFRYDSITEFGQSLAPTTKYNLTFFSAACSAFMVAADKLVSVVFGIDGMAFMALVAVLFTELVTGITASAIRKEAFESSKLRRFLFRLFYYMVLISVPFLFSENYRTRGNTAAHWAFDWLHTGIVIQVVFENLTSVLENIAVIEGKKKTYLISKIKERIKTLI